MRGGFVTRAYAIRSRWHHPRRQRRSCVTRFLQPRGDRHAGIAPGLGPGDGMCEVCRTRRFTFVSDGVVEAENAQRELFGFDRAREISKKSARENAEAAKAWGQNDDITVVTVRRNP